MIVTGMAVFKGYRSGISKAGNSYSLLELGGADYEKCSISVPDDFVSRMAEFKDGDSVAVSISLTSRYGGGLSGNLKSIQKK